MANQPASAVAHQDEPASDAAAARLAMLRALPVCDEPLTDEEREAFEEGERFLRSGQHGHTTEEILTLLDQMQHDAAE